jgi:DNA/RNA-binding domain of Phe-tRNA-synthetase-like protein
MDMMFQVSDECKRLGLRAGAVAFRGIRVGVRSAELHEAILATAREIRAKFSDSHAVSALPEVIAFQEVLRQVGVNPRKLQPSVERLLNYVLKRGDLPAINSFVDAYNLVSVQSLCSLGAHDLDRIALPVSLRLLAGDESFTPLGRDRAEPVIAGEFGYVDASGRVMCRLDVLQAEYSKVTPNTTSALLIVEGTTVHSAELLDRTVAAAIEAVTRHCGGSAEVITTIWDVPRSCESL